MEFLSLGGGEGRDAPASVEVELELEGPPAAEGVPVEVVESAERVSTLLLGLRVQGVLAVVELLPHLCMYVNCTYEKIQRVRSECN